MLKKISLFVGLCIALSSLFTACNKSEDANPKGNTEVALKRGDILLLSKYSMKKPSKNKGYYVDETDSIHEGIAYEDASTSQYKTIEVRRPNGRVFYIMIENLRRPTPDNKVCYGYNFDESNVPTKGRLYTFDGAKNLALKVYMKLPTFNKTTNAKYLDSKGNPILKRINARLPTRTDWQDLLEAPSVYVSNLSDALTLESRTATAPFIQKGYYDAFLAGVGAAFGDSARISNSLAGYGYCIDAHYYFNGFATCGLFWTNDLYPLNVRTCGANGEYYDFIAYVNAGISPQIDANNFQMLSVRYVFEPTYL